MSINYQQIKKLLPFTADTSLNLHKFIQNDQIHAVHYLRISQLFKATCARGLTRSARYLKGGRGGGQSAQTHINKIACLLPMFALVYNTIGKFIFG